MIGFRIFAFIMGLFYLAIWIGLPAYTYHQTGDVWRAAGVTVGGSLFYVLACGSLWVSFVADEPKSKKEEKV